jgi:hypothetical protein
MSETEDWYAKYQREQAQRLDRAQKMTRYLMGALRFFGVKRVTVAFDGSGDDGEVQEPVYDPAPAGGLPEGLDLALRDAMHHQLPGGWEINAGSVGDIVIDVAAGTCDVNVEWREDEDEEEYEVSDEGEG